MRVISTSVSAKGSEILRRDTGNKIAGVTSEEGIPPRILEQTIKETVRQMGARVVEEAKG